MPSADSPRIDALVHEATQLARQNRTAEARDRIDRAYRLLTPDSPAAQRAALMLAHSSCLFFENRLEEAMETIHQARALAAGLHVADLEAECDALLALFHTRGGDLAQSVRLARRALRLAGADNAAARYRAHLALATVMQVVGLPEAFDEYRAAQEQARRIRDDIAVAATVHRMAIAQAISARQRFEAGQLDVATAREAIVGLQSSLDVAAAAAPRQTRVPDGLMLAQLYLMTGQIDSATALYEDLIPRARAEGHARLMTHSFAEFGLCRALAGRVDDARALVTEALATELATDDAMTLAVLYRAAHAVYARLGQPDKLAELDRRAREHWVEFEAQQRRWREVLRATENEVN